MTLKKASLIIGVLIGMIALGGSTYKGYCHFAKTEEVKLLSMRLDNKIVEDRINQLQDRIWKIEDRYDNKPMPLDIKDMLRRMKKEIELLNKKMMVLRS